MIYQREDAIRNQIYIEMFQEEGKKLGVEVKLLLVNDLDFGVRDGKLYLEYKKQPLEAPDFFVCRTIFPLLTRHLELMGMKVFNNSKIAEICNDKAKTYQYISKLGIKMVDTSFYLRDEYERASMNLPKAAVIKAVDGHGGSQVFLTDCIDDTIIKGINESSFVVQPLTGTRHQDLRVYVIGKEIIGCVLRTSKEGFRSNFSLGGKVEAYELSDKETMVVRRIIDEFDFGMVGIDFIVGDNGELIFNEIEDVVGSRMLYQCSDVNFVRKYLEHMIEQCK